MAFNNQPAWHKCPTCDNSHINLDFYKIDVIKGTWFGDYLCPKCQELFNSNYQIRGFRQIGISKLYIMLINEDDYLRHMEEWKCFIDTDEPYTPIKELPSFTKLKWVYNTN